MDHGVGLYGREEELAAGVRALAGGGCSLVGPAGVGKTRLASALAEWAEGEGWHVVRVRTSANTAELPLGAFLPQLGPDERFLTPLFAELRDRIDEAAGGRQVLVTVDDVDQLDDVSLVLVQQMVAHRASKLVTTMRAGRIPPNELVDLWLRGEVTRIELHPLDLAGTGRLAAAVLGTALASTAAERLHEVTQGNPLFIRELLMAAEEQGQILLDDRGLVSLTFAPGQSARVTELVATRLAHLDPVARRTIEHLAFAEPCGWAELASVGDLDVLADLEDAKLVVVEPDRKRLTLRLAHPLYGEALRGSTSHLGRRTILATLARDLQATGVRRRSDRLRLARMAVDGGVAVEPEVLEAAASIAFHAGDLMLTERIGRAAFEASDTFMAGWGLAQALYQLGDLDGSREHLARWQDRATTSAQRLEVALTAAQLEFWYAGDLAAAEAITHRAIETHGSGHGEGPGSSAEELLANLAMFVAAAGEPQRALALAEPMLSDDPGPVLIRAALAAANALGTSGRCRASVEVLQRAVLAFAAIGSEGVSLSERIIESARAVGRAWAGDLAGSQADATRALAEATNEFQVAAANLSGALVPILRGKPTTAIPAIERALGWWARAAAGSTERRWALTRLVWATAEAGDLEAADHALALLDADHSPGVLFDYEAALGRSTVLMARGHGEQSRDVLRTALAVERAHGRVVGEAMCAYGLARLGGAHEVAGRLRQLVELAGPDEGQLLPAMADHAHAVIAEDLALLASAAHRWAALGFMRYAAEAATQVLAVARRVGDQRAIVAWAAQAREWAAMCDEVAAPVDGPVVEPVVPLTRREREIGLLAVEGLANKEIAERLFISVRTAENHLAKVFDKLGVRSRAELAAIFDTH